MNVHIHVHHEPDDEVKKLLTQILKEIQKMPSFDEVKAAVDAAAQKVKDDITAAVQKETAEVVAQIQAIPVGATFTQEQADALVASVRGISTAATGAIDTISQNDGGAQ